MCNGGNELSKLLRHKSKFDMQLKELYKRKINYNIIVKHNYI